MVQRIHVAVGTKNPCKIDAVVRAFKEVFSTESREIDIFISTHNVDSGVRDQPFGDEETKQGAKNRAKLAYQSALSIYHSCKDEEVQSNQDDAVITTPPDFAVGLEGGIDTVTENGENSLWCMAWMAVLGSDSEICTYLKSSENNTRILQGGKGNIEIWGIAKTASFCLPKSISNLVLNEGIELGDADDRVFKRKNAKHFDGTVGFLTRSMINRAEYYIHALKLALIPFLRPEYYVYED